jgi:subtilase family protein
MRTKWLVCVVLAIFLASLSAPAGAAEGDRIVRTKVLNGLPVISGVCRLLGCTVLLSLDTTPGSTAPSSLFLVRGLVDSVLTLTLSLLGLASVEPDRPAYVSQSADWPVNQASAAVLDELYNRTPVSYYGTTAWEGYLQQPANDIVRLRETHCSLRQTGAGIVAVIDTGVDPDHPALGPVLVAGYDFTRNTGGGSEKADSSLGQASAAVLDGTYVVNSSTLVMLNQASAAVLDDPAHAAFGHGTMAAGIVHLAAPTAKIMPLKAFGADGQGYTSDIIRAIYYATQKGAKVLSMSFSRPTSSAELKRAIDNAVGKGLIAVASAGNDGSSSAVYPAAYDNVIGVASTSNADTRSSFSNYGAKDVWVAAPGEGIITTYPWGSFAAAWGTSFSAPYVSGQAALLVGMSSGASQSQVASAVSHAKRLTTDLNYGRVDFYQGVQAGRALWPYAPKSPVPGTCTTSAVDWSEIQ